MADLKGRLEGGQNQHAEIVELLPWYANGTLESEERARVQAHLQSCSACRMELDEMRGLQSALMQELPDLSGVLMQEALQAVRARPKSTEPQPVRKPDRKQERPEKPAKERRIVLRPRLAFTFSAFVIVVAASVYIGTLLGTGPAVISNRPDPNDRGTAAVGGYFVLTREYLQQGTFTTQLGGQVIATEDFSLERNDDGNLHLTSEIISQERIGAGERASQDLYLTSDYRPTSYLLTGGLVYQGNRVEASIAGNRAFFTRANLKENINRPVDLREFPVLQDFSVMSQFQLIYSVIASQLQKGIAPEQISLTALTPQALRVEPLKLESVGQAFLESPDGSIATTRYRIKIGEVSDKDPLIIELYGAGDDLIAVYMPRQAKLATTSGIFAYRSDMHPVIAAPAAR